MNVTNVDGVQYAKGKKTFSALRTETILWADDGFYDVDVSRLFLLVVGFEWEKQVTPTTYAFLEGCVPDKTKVPSLLTLHASYSVYEDYPVSRRDTGLVSYTEFAAYFDAKMRGMSGARIIETGLTAETEHPDYTNTGLRRVDPQGFGSDRPRSVLEMFVTSVEQTT